MPKFLNRFKRNKPENIPRQEYETVPEDTSVPKPETLNDWEYTTDSWGTTLRDYFDWVSDALHSLMEYAPIRFSWGSDLDNPDSADRISLNYQLKRKDLRAKLSRQKIARSRIIRSNHHKDVSRAQQKRKICNNWYDSELDFLVAHKEESLGIIPGLEEDSNYSRISGWEIKESDINFRGPAILCNSLNCDGSAQCPEPTNNKCSEPTISRQSEASVSLQLKDNADIYSQQTFSNLNHYQNKILNLEEQNKE
jgi:hypothetical protein